MSVNQCPTCRMYAPGPHHKCLPLWKVRIPDWEADWNEIRALDEEDAATGYFEECNDEFNEGPIDVQVINSEGIVEKWECTAEASLSYNAVMTGTEKIKE